MIDGRTGWLVDAESRIGTRIAELLHELADEGRAGEVIRTCRAWARCFSWDRSAELLAGVLLDPEPPACARHARTDMATIARFTRPQGWTAGRMRTTDHVVAHGDEAIVLLHGCDEVDTAAVLHRLGVRAARMRLADRYDLLTGPSDALRLDPRSIR